MKKNNFTKGVFTALLLSSSVVVADSKYPAADFEPTVVYQNPEYTSSKSTSAAPAKAPAAAKHSAPAAPAHSVADPKYPAANFEPKVVYHNPDIKADKSVPASAVAGSASASSSASDDGKSTPAVSKEKDSSSNYLFGLIALAAVGFVFFRSKSETSEAETKRAPARAVAGSAGSLTGVARYLNKKSGTGVSRYVERQAKSVKTATGVARYMAKQAVASRENVSNVQAKTGVERYMRDRG